MIHRTLHMKEWLVDVFIDNGGKGDFSLVTDCLLDMGVDSHTINRAVEKYESGVPNEAFTASNGTRACIYIGHTTSGAEFINSIVHEIRHLIDFIADYYEIEDKEIVGYMSGDAAFLLAEDICTMGCQHRRKEAL